MELDSDNIIRDGSLLPFINTNLYAIASRTARYSALEVDLPVYLGGIAGALLVIRCYGGDGRGAVI